MPCDRGPRPALGLLLLTAAVAWPPGPQARASVEAAQALPVVTPTAGMVIDRSVRIAPGTYRLPALADRPAIAIRGDGVVVDLSGVVIEGGDPLADPDGYTGTGIGIEQSAGVVVRGGVVRGFRVGLLARQTPRLHLTGGDFSHNWKARLASGIERESLVDWMSYHQNEQDEWLRYAAAVYLRGCDDCQIDRVRVHQGQNGLMVTHSARLKIWNNDFSFNSAVGLGLYRVTDSVIQHNRLDWNVRGYSHGFYYRGQDSTAILMYEQTSRNVVAYNSMTHGGDGVFLWAGQSTMDTGQGGANDNVFHRNDVSHAVANGIEATFSRNRFLFNRIDDCWHGVWGGYSYDSIFHGNTFAANDEAMAIEHGQNIRVTHNRFAGDTIGIRLWANPTQDPNWGYPKARDTRSRDYRIEGNTFAGHEVALDVARTTNVVADGNTFEKVVTPLKLGPAVEGLRFEPGSPFAPGAVRGPDPLPGAIDAMLPDGARRGRSTIIVDEWGPYDYRSPKLWPVGKPTDRPLTLRVLGPDGRWALESVRGGRVDRTSGPVPGEVVITPSGRGADVDLVLRYTGGEVVSSRGERFAAGTPVPFRYTLFDPAVDWTVRAWTFDAASDPIASPEAFAARLGTAPASTRTLAHLGFVSGRTFLPDLPADRVALRAEGRVTIPAGRHDLEVMSDDGVRVWIDDALVIDRWDVHESTVDRVRLAPGRHRIRIDYFEMTGWAELQVRFRRQ